MIVRFFGHSCFLFYSNKKNRILTDPFSEEFDYPMPPLTCEIVVISHEHQNHNALWRIHGQPYVVKRTNPGFCEFEIPLPLTGETFIFKGVPTYHDEFHGKRRGPNTAFVWTMEQLRVCHLGDLGHTLTREQRDHIGKVDILLLPVGGGSRVIGAKTAVQVAKELEAKVIFPMHFKTDVAGEGLEKIDDFLELAPGVTTVESNQYEIETLPAQPTVIHLALREGEKSEL